MSRLLFVFIFATISLPFFRGVNLVIDGLLKAVAPMLTKKFIEVVSNTLAHLWIEFAQNAISTLNAVLDGIIDKLINVLIKDGHNINLILV